MVGSTGAIKTMRLLRNKNKRDETTTATVMDNSTVAVAAASNSHKRHNSSITSNTSSVSTASSASSASSTSSQHHHSCSHHHHQNLHHQHHRHHRSNSMRDQCLDLPYDGTDDGGHLQQPAIAYRQSPASVWVFPPLPPQPNLYCNTSQDALIQFEKAGLKGFRKQFSGRFKRFVLRKPAEPAPAIPPELKCQLKTIFVY